MELYYASKMDRRKPRAWLKPWVPSELASQRSFATRIILTSYMSIVFKVWVCPCTSCLPCHGQQHERFHVHLPTLSWAALINY